MLTEEEIVQKKDTVADCDCVRNRTDEIHILKLRLCKNERKNHRKTEYRRIACACKRKKNHRKTEYRRIACACIRRKKSYRYNTQSQTATV